MVNKIIVYLWVWHRAVKHTGYFSTTGKRIETAFTIASWL